MATVTINHNRKSHIVDLLQISLLGAFMHALLLHGTLCIN